MKTPTRIAPLHSGAQHGSVLIFVVVLLAVLALLSATTLFIVRQGVQVSQNAAQSVESRLAADSGLRHATKALRDAVTTSSIYTPEGVFFFDPVNNGSHPWLKKTDPLDPVNPVAPPLASPLRMFADEVTPIEDESVPLSMRDDEVATSLQRYRELRYSSSPILPQVRDQFDFALVNRIVGETATFYKGADAAFAKDKFKAKPLTRISGIRGRYFIWIKDLDAKLYARNKEWNEDPAGTFAHDYAGWGLDTYRTIDPADLSIGGSTPEEQQSLWEEQIRGNMLKYDFEGQRLITEDTLADQLRDLYVQTLPNFDARYPHFHSNKELATQLADLYDTTDPLDIQIADLEFYSQYHAELEHYFTVYQDAPNYNSALLQKSVKQHPAALNINTASVEVIAAALSQIPAEDVSDPLIMTLTLGTRVNGAAAESVANALAKRIVAKRPFLCRMDFEDFLAAHLRGAFNNSVPEIDLSYEPVLGDLDNPTEPEFATLNGNLPFVRMIYYSMFRRLGPGYKAATGSAYATEDENEYKLNPELSLAQYLEIPGVPNNAEYFRAANISGLTEAYPNFPAYQRARFMFFYNDDQGSNFGAGIAPRQPALITPREFNNIINSINGAAINDDLQNQPVGAVTNLPVILAGPNGTLETSPQGDDTFIKRIYPGVNTVLDTARAGDDIVDAGTIIPGPNGVFDSALSGDDEMKTDNSAIWPGSNGIAETWLSSHRPSYYSFINDVKFAGQFWDSVDGALNALPNNTPGNHMRDPAIASVSVAVPEYGVMTIPASDRMASKVMRLYYRLNIAPGTATAPPYVDALPDPLRPNLVNLSHLVTWRCNPIGMSSRAPTDPLFNPALDSETRASFFQISFDEWPTFSTYNYNAFCLGPFQCMGDPDLYWPTIDDSDPALARYSNAKPWSGHTSGGPLDTDQNGVIDQPEEQGLGNGDVSWSPKFAFRSRFFNIFVLGQGVAGPGSDTSTLAEEELKLRPQGEKRVEAVYDALLDQIIWQRTPVTDKRAMGEPVPPSP